MSWCWYKWIYFIKCILIQRNRLWFLNLMSVTLALYDNVKLQETQSGYTKLYYSNISFKFFYTSYPWILYILRYKIPGLCDISLIWEKKIIREILPKKGVRNIKADKYSTRRNFHTPNMLTENLYCHKGVISTTFFQNKVWR